jgi:tetratricopeptide (TPR) repeat protein
MHACVLCHKYQDAIDIFDDLVQGELASAAEWQWEGKKDALHPACRDLAIRSLGELKTMEKADEIKKQILELYNQARQDESKISTDAILAVVSAWDDDLETVLSIILPLFESGSLSRIVMGDDTQITSEQQQLPTQTSLDIIHELGSLLDLSMQICNSFQKFGLSLLCFRLFEITLMLSDLISDQQLETITVMKGQYQYSNIVQTILPLLSIFRNSKEILNTLMVSLCGVKLPQEAINLHDAVVADCADEIPREMHDVYEYAEFLRSSTDSASYQSWEPAHRHIHRLTASLACVEENESMLTTSESILLSSTLATAIRECTVTSNPEAGIVLGRWVESRPILGTTDEAPSLFSETKTDGIGLPVRLTDSLLSAAVEGFAQCGKMRFAESLIQTNLGNDRSPSNWLLSYHEAMKLLFSQGQNTDGLALFRTVIASAKNPDVFCTVAKSLIASGNWRQVLDLYRQAISSGCSSEELSLLTMESISASGRIGQIDGQFPLLRSIISETSKSLGVSPAVWIETNYWKFKRVLGFSIARLIMGWDDYKLSRLDELDQAIETLEKRSIVGLTPKNAVLFSIVQAAANLEQYAVPYNATGLPKVPRDTDSWIKLIDKVLDEAKETRLFYEPNFIFEASLALRRVDRHVECLEIVSEALSRGLKLNKATLENAVLAGQAVGMEDATADMKMLLEGPS